MFCGDKLYGKNTGKGDVKCLRGSISKAVVREGLTRKLTFEQRWRNEPSASLAEGILGREDRDLCLFSDGIGYKEQHLALRFSRAYY